MADDGPTFTDSQRRSIGVCVSQLAELVEALRGYGIGDTWLDPIEVAMRDLELTTAAHRPAPPRTP